MIIGIDVDNVLAALSSSMHGWHEREYGYLRPLEERIKFSLAYSWNCSEEEATKRLLEFYKSEDFKNVKPLEGAVEGINKLAKIHELHAITARPKYIKEETFKWLDNHFSLSNFKDIHLNGQCMTSDVVKTKAEICKDLGVDLMIEDALHYAEDCAKKGIKVILLDCPWNQTDELHSNITRVKNWNEIFALIPKT